jgi:two-component system sensor kinase FixL
MTENNSALSGRYNIIWVGLVVGLGFYVADIIIDVFVFHSGTLKEEILNPTEHEMWMRMTVLIVAVAFSIYIQLLLGREQKISERVKTTEKFLNSVVDNIPNMIFIKDAEELRFIRVNQAGEQLLGLTTKELIGKNDYDFFPEPQAAFFTSKDREVLESRIEVNIPEEQIDTVGLGKRWLHTRKVPILDDKGQAMYLLGISEDITDARQAALDLKKTEIRFQTLFDSAADFIFVIDPEGKILEVNRYACEQSGYEKKAIVGQNIKKFFTRESQDTCDCNFPDLRARGYSRADIEFVGKDGGVMQMECLATGVPDESGCFTTFLVIQRDVTDKKKAEEEIQQQQREMAHVMRLSTMGEMASSMAHELNQPLTALTSYCGTAAILAGSLPSTPPQLGEVLEQATEQAHRAGRIISHLREFLSKGDDHRKPVDLDKVIAEMIVFLKPELKNGNMRIEHRPGASGCKVMANKVQIEQVLVNLVRNSLEALHGSEKTTGNIVIQTRLLPDRSIETTVTDDGPGIAADMADRIFSPFQTSKPSGMGMGLSISRSIIEAHEGKIWADEQYRDGALVGFSLSGCVDS